MMANSIHWIETNSIGYIVNELSLCQTALQFVVQIVEIDKDETLFRHIKHAKGKRYLLCVLYVSLSLGFFIPFRPFLVCE